MAAAAAALVMLQATGPSALGDALVAALAEALDDEGGATGENCDLGFNDDNGESLSDGDFQGAWTHEDGAAEEQSGAIGRTFRKKRSVVTWVTHFIFKHNAS
jgi:hypothetical protein